ncbi:MAG: hypothetical protein WAU21_09430 [Chitinophagales bacterium]|nr:hypothetical protein [Bacteroidota bacterium]MBK8488091.1 hypothetical protein [Bacteroidota bacterium]MBP9549823.1 hypothetical protein [Chitinophagales bacterium]
MNNYFAKLAARNNQENNHSLLPIISTNTLSNEKALIDEREKLKPTEFAQKNEDFQQDLLTIQPQPKQSILEKNETPELKNNNVTSYLLKHIDRINDFENKDAAINNHYTSEEMKYEDSAKSLKKPKQPLGNLTPNSTKSILSEEDYSNSKSYTEENPEFILPSQIQSLSSNKLISNKKGVERIVSNMGANKNKQLVHNRNQIASPKLVIGKIIVEIISPKTISPPKIITRIVSQNAKPNSSKSNKLSFGLGQM